MINLLPPQEKEDLLQMKRQKITIILGFMFFTFLICLSLVLFTLNIRLGSKISSENIFYGASKKELETDAAVNLQKELEYYNKNLSAVETFYKNSVSLSDILQRFAGILPGGVYLMSLSYSKDSSQFQLTGFAPTGEDLQAFKKSLEGQDDFYDISFPPSNWVKLADIIFKASFKVKTIPTK